MCRQYLETIAKINFHENLLALLYFFHVQTYRLMVFRDANATKERIRHKHLISLSNLLIDTAALRELCSLVGYLATMTASKFYSVGPILKES
jgi:hypothetical protein